MTTPSDPTPASTPDVAAWFEIPTMEAWEAEARRTLRGRDPSQLASRLPEGFSVPVLHGPADVGPLGPVDASPWRRGEGGIARRSTGWTVGVSIDSGALSTDLELAAAAVQGGAAALVWTLPAGAEAWPSALASHLAAADLPLPELLGDGAPHPQIAAFVVDTAPCAEAGGTAVHELALLLAEGAALLRAGAITGRSTVRMAVQRDTFVEIAKLRAARWAWAKLMAAAGQGEDAQRLRLVVMPARSTWTTIDPWINQLRGGHGVFVAAVAGADVVVQPCWDRALGVPEPSAARLAATTQAVLRDEAALSSVADPAGGSWYVEHLTERLAREAWSLFQAVEAEGGIEVVRATTWADRIAAAASRAEGDAATRRQGIVGVSLFPLADEATLARKPAPLAARRPSAPWEALRARGQAASPAVWLLTLGARWQAREGFCRPLVEAAGFVASTGPVTSLPPGWTGGVVLCGDDADYADAVPTALAACPLAAFRVLAGAPGDAEAGWRALGLTHTLARGDNMVTKLSDLLTAAGVSA